MGLWLICPLCQAKIPPAFQACSACGADLRDLPRTDRRYFIGEWAVVESVDLSLETMPAAMPETMEKELMASYPETMPLEASLPGSQEVSLCEALDRILHKGAVLFGEVIISVADIDLVYLSLQVILASMETARGFKSPGEGLLGPNLLARGAC